MISSRLARRTAALWMSVNLGRSDFAIPPGVLRPGEPTTLAVLVENMGHNDDWTAREIRQRQPHGLTGAVVAGSSAPIRWRIQGTRGGEDLVDRVRGRRLVGVQRSRSRAFTPVSAPTNRFQL